MRQSHGFDSTRLSNVYFLQKYINKLSLSGTLFLALCSEKVRWGSNTLKN